MLGTHEGDLGEADGVVTPVSEKQKKLIRQLTDDGWTLVPNIAFTDLLELCEELGDRWCVKRLVARSETEALVPSLSANHGLGRFPPHTDGAEDVEPPRYVALWSPAKHGTATLLYDGEDPSLDCKLFSQAWLTGVGRRRFYVIPRQTDGEYVRWRLNLDCMHPASSDGSPEKILACFDTLSPIRVEWQSKQALVFDNARVLHGREALPIDERERELMRVSVY